MWLLAGCDDAQPGAPAMTMPQGAVSAGTPPNPSAAGSQASPVAGAGGGPTAGVMAAPPTPTFGYIYANAFKSCTLATCHGAGIAGVDMSSRQAAYASLVNQPPQPMGRCESTHLARVVPFEPDKSLLVAKLEISAPCGQQMPIGGLLPSAQRDLIRMWIAQGALDD
jgi:hypothetical protein